MPMNRSHLDALGRTLAVTLSLTLALGCSLYKAKRAYDEGRYEDAAQAYHDLLQQDPSNIKARIGYRRAASLAAEQHLDKAKQAQSHGQEEQVFEEVRRAVRLDPNNAVAMEWLARMELAAQRRQTKLEQPDSIDTQKKRGEAKNTYQLNPRSIEGMDLNFSRKTSLREILASLSRASGVNILTHTSFQDVQVSMDLRGLNFQRVLDTLMLQNDLFYKVLDTNTIMIFKSNAQNRDLYENQLLYTFYLSNAEVDGVRQIFTTLVPAMKVFTDKRLNAVTVKAKPNELQIAKRIVNQLDKAKPEVMIYVELMEVTENNLEQVGMLPVVDPSGTDGIYRIGVQADASGTSGLNTNKGGIRLSRSDLKFLFPSLALDALKSNGDAKMVASPNVRVLSGEKGEINIGEKISTTQSSLGLPNTSSSSTTTTSSTASSYLSAYSTQYSYEDVGVKISVEPRVHFNNDITLKIESSVTTLKSGSTAGRPDLGKREIKTLARLRDGETAVFGGLLKEEEQKSLQGIWGITDIPVLGKLLGSNMKKRAKTDVILTIRAVLVRKPELSEEDFEAFDPDRATTQNAAFAAEEAPETGAQSAKAAAPAQEKPAPAVPQAPVPPPQPALQPAPPAVPQPVAPQPQPAAIAPPAPQAAPAPAVAPVITPAAQPPQIAPAAPAAPQPAPQPPTDGKAQPATPAKPTDKAEVKPEPAPEPSELVLFISPLSTQIAKGDSATLQVLVSGGKGVDSGSIELRLDPKLKFQAVRAGDFLMAEGGFIQQDPVKDGLVKVTFKRSGTATDSGALLSLDLEGLTKGNAPVVIQGGRYLVGKNPIAAKVVNALVEVE